MRRLMVRMIAANVVLVLLIGLVAIGAAVRTTNTINFLTREIEPAARANSTVIQNITDAETHIRGWSLSGRQNLVDRFRLSLASYRGAQQDLRRLATGDDELARLVERQRAAGQAWINGYAAPRLQKPGGASNFDSPLFNRGLELFNELREVNGQVVERLQDISSEAEAEANRRLVTTVVVLILMTLVGLAVALMIARRAGRQIVDPLMDLHGTVERLADGDLAARARLEGPVESVRVASALNALAQESERSRAVEAEILEQLRDLDSVKTDFVSNVSHELRTPLTSIGGYVELLEEELRDRLTDDELEMLHAAKRNVARLRELIEDLLTLTRAEHRGTDLRQIDLVAMLKELVTDLSISAGQRNVRLDLQLPDRPLVVLADESQIARAVTNLVANAVKYSHGATVVEIVLEVSGADALLSVHDQGIGIPADEMEELGSRFYRASNAVGLGISGTGLGLRIVQAILENHRGALELESTAGRGTTARMRLPLQSELAIEGGGNLPPG